jgi:acetate kinase
MPTGALILVLNSGSSSVKAAWFRADAGLRRLGAGVVADVGTPNSTFSVTHSPDEVVREEQLDGVDHEAAIDLLLTHVETWESAEPVAAIGHRIVHGGSEFAQPVLIDEEVLARLTPLTALAPIHLPQNLAGIAAAGNRWPGLPQVACFDTGFHRTMPDVARLTGLPRELEKQGLRRYGFHGLSCESVLASLAEHEGPAAAAGRIIVAHLGSGASMAAIANVRSMESTMGFSTLGGLLMGTRCGDIDPGLLLYLLNERIVDLPGAQALLYEKSGLLGVSGISGDIRDLLGRQRPDAARDAVALFCYSAQKHLAALTAVLGGLDRIVFTGGIGENSAEVRQRICAGLVYLGVDLDPDRNERHERTISFPDSPVAVHVIPANEEMIIARHTYQLAVSRGTNAPEKPQPTPHKWP